MDAPKLTRKQEKFVNRRLPELVKAVRKDGLRNGDVAACFEFRAGDMPRGDVLYLKDLNDLDGKFAGLGDRIRGLSDPRLAVVVHRADEDRIDVFFHDEVN